MKSRYIALVPIATLLTSLFLSTISVEAQTGLLTQTRRSAIVTTLSENQVESGGFSAFTLGSSTEGGPYHTAQILRVLGTLNALDTINLEEAINHIISNQNKTVGNTTIWGWPAQRENTYVSDLDAVYTVVLALKLVHAENRINQPALIDFIMSRYNESDGAFHEPVTEIETTSGTRNVTTCGFPLEFYAISDMAYANSNMISTFLGTSTLALLDVSNQINVTKTLDWISSCRAENGAFKPFPRATSSYLPPWSSLPANPFYVDSFGTGIAYTYAAISTLKTLGRLEYDNILNQERLTNYVLSSREDLFIDSQILFRAHPEDQRITVGVGSRHYTYYAVAILQDIGKLDQEMPAVTGALNRILEEQNLMYVDSWPVPNGPGYYRVGGMGNVYGLFLGDFLPVSATTFAVAILNVTDGLRFLDQMSPAASKAWFNLVVLSIMISGLSFILLVVLAAKRNKRRQPFDQQTAQQSDRLNHACSKQPTASST